MNKTKTSQKVRVVYRILQCMICASVLLIGCKEDVQIPDGALEEQVVDLRGDWNLEIVSQNSNDISDLMSFSDLTLRLEMDSEGPTNYQIETAGLPFVVLQDGVWSVDDVAYPTTITFSTSDESTTVLLDRPPVSGGNYLSVSFSLGCNANTYVYKFLKQ